MKLTAEADRLLRDRMFNSHLPYEVAQAFRDYWDTIDSLIVERDQSILAAYKVAAEQCGLMHMFVKVGSFPYCEYLGFDHDAAAKSILALTVADALRAMEPESGEK